MAVAVTGTNANRAKGPSSLSGTTRVPTPIKPGLSDPGGGREGLVAAIVITAATALVYSNTFDQSFHFDDFHAIVNNPSLRSLGNQWPPSGNRWLGNLSFALNHRLGGLAVSGYHAVNLFIHACNGLLVAWLAALTLRSPTLRGADAGQLIGRYLPLTAGLLFAVHPVATQAVTYVVQRFASLATFFYLVSVISYALARLSWNERGGRVRAAAAYGVSLIAAAAAMRTKEIAYTLPLALAGYDLLLFRPSKVRTRLLVLAPLAALALLLLPLHDLTRGQGLAGVLEEPNRFATETEEIPRAIYLLTQSRVVVTYLRLFLLPINQNVDYDFRLSSSPGDPEVLFALAVLAAVAALALVLLAKARAANRAAGVLVFFGVAWFFLTLSVESTLIPIRDVIFEHRMYLPSVGASVALATAVLGGVERVRWRASLGLKAAVALLLTAAPLGAATYARNRVWKDEITLWSDAVAKSPRKVRPHGSLADAYRSSGRLDDAVREYLEVIRIDPGNSQAHNSLGRAYWDNGRLDDAAREYLEAIRLDPLSAEPHNNLGLVHFKNGRFEDAVQEWLQAIRLDPGLAEAHGNLGDAYRMNGRLDDALREYRQAIRLRDGGR
jgi:tetratricopeptide (TPR) repeat protein